MCLIVNKQATEEFKKSLEGKRTFRVWKYIEVSSLKEGFRTPYYGVLWKKFGTTIYASSLYNGETLIESQGVHCYLKEPTEFDKNWMYSHRKCVCVYIDVPVEDFIACDSRIFWTEAALTKLTIPASVKEQF